jgi:21S rRNA (GM2251-2'-O)-methyltransferase
MGGLAITTEPQQTGEEEGKKSIYCHKTFLFSGRVRDTNNAMSFITKLPLLGRQPILRVGFLPLSSQRCASRLSAIHQGLNRSERARPQGSFPRKEIRQKPGDDPYMTPEERRRARRVARENPLTYKIRKGKKDITEEPGPPRKSRRARFLDPRDSLGQKSLVKKFKTGQMFDGVEMGRRADSEGSLQHDDFARQMFGNVPDRSSTGKFGGKRGGDAPGRFDRGEQSGGFERNAGGRDSRPSQTQPRGHSAKERGGRDQRTDEGRFEGPSKGFDRDARDSRAPSDSRAHSPRSASTYGSERTRTFDSSWRDREPRSSHRSERPRSTDHGSAGAENITAWKPQRFDGPVSLPYTTAASQFLYGTSAVEAALTSGRRKMYKLYIYNGKGRSSRALEKDQALADLARTRGVKVEHLEEDSLPLLNKMSDSRPHNGHVLEASPLPQLPVTALGEFSEYQEPPEFKVFVGYQSSEEAQINGTSRIISTKPSSRKPLVLVVEQVLDPGNLGAIIRTASFMGVTAVAISKKGSAPLTPVVLKASAGAAETLTMLSVEEVEDFLLKSRKNGWKVFAACAPKPGSSRPMIDSLGLEKQDPLLNDPCILLVGNEGEGLRRSLRRAADFEVSIPNLSGSDVVDSLNVSVATGLLCSAFLKGKAKERRNTAGDAGALF